MPRKRRQPNLPIYKCIELGLPYYEVKQGNTTLDMVGSLDKARDMVHRGISVLRVNTNGTKEVVHHA